MTFGYSTLLTGVHEVDWPTYMLYFSFTIFAFLLIEGIKKTSNKYAYFRRIVLFTVISEIPHDLLICGNWWDVSRQSIMLSILIAFII
ncbi:MAG: conjugal transfer protein TraX, partial [Firmicutes bacterium]|nr:conjugal transfer protein TraX [Bacillota bacterium]